MLYEIEISDRKGRACGIRSFPLFFGCRCAIGSDPDNDLILLDEEVPPHAGILQAGWGRPLWIPPMENPKEAQSGREFRIGPFEFRARTPLFIRLGIWTLLGMLSATFLVSRFTGDRVFVPDPETRTVEVPLPARGSFGPVSGGRRVSEARFKFNEAENHPVEIHFSPGNVQASDQIAIELNGTRLGFVSACSGRWGIEERFRADAPSLRIGPNRLRFVSLKPDLSENAWGVRNVYVARPRADAGISQDTATWLAAARESFERRFSRQGELWKARRYLERAIQAAASVRMDPPQGLLEFKAELEKEEGMFLRRRIAEVRAALSLGDRRRALALFRSLRAEFIDPANPLRREVEKSGKELGL